MTIVQFPKPRSKPVLKVSQDLRDLVNRPPGHITQGQFEAAHELIDETEARPLMSEQAERFFAFAEGTAREFTGAVETKLLAMSDDEITELFAAPAAEGTIEFEMVDMLVHDEMQRRSLLGRSVPDGVA